MSLQCSRPSHAQARWWCFQVPPLQRSFQLAHSGWQIRQNEDAASHFVRAVWSSCHTTPRQFLVMYWELELVTTPLMSLLFTQLHCQWNWDTDGDAKITPVCGPILPLRKLPPYSVGTSWLILERIGGLQCLDCGHAPFGEVTTVGTHWRMGSRQVHHCSRLGQPW